MSDRDVTRDLRRRLTNRFGRTSGSVGMPEHAVLFEVPVDGVKRWDWETASGAAGTSEMKVRRRIDAVAVGMWKRTDHLVHGFEIKASRADLVKELRDPLKSEPARRLCDRWWLVLADRKLLGDDQVPDGWGVLYRSGHGLRVLVKPEPIETVRDPRFVAALVQSAMGGNGAVARGLGRVDGYAAGHKRGKAAGELVGVREAHRLGVEEGYEMAMRRLTA